MKTCRNCGKEFKQLVVIDGIQRNLAKRQYCLDCSPFGKRNRKILEKTHSDSSKFCPRCDETKPLQDFYPKKSTGYVSCYCKKCTNLQSKERQWKFKKRCLEYKGGKCTECGYDRSIAALDFHHSDPDAKEFGISQLRFHVFEAVKQELDKCVILCSNCHRELHFAR